MNHAFQLAAFFPENRDGPYGDLPPFIFHLFKACANYHFLWWSIVLEFKRSKISNEATLILWQPQRIGT